MEGLLGWLQAKLVAGPLGWGVLLSTSVLAFYSVCSIGVMVDEERGLRRARELEDESFPQLRDKLRESDLAGVRAAAKASLAPSGFALTAGLDHGSADQEIMREAIAQEVVVQTSALQGRLPFLATVASTAPYIGLFGTVLGILDAFHVIATTGQTGASVVAGGISEALIATALGLAVAIPAVMAYNYFTGQVSKLSLVVETHAVDLSSRLAEWNFVTGRREDGTVTGDRAGSRQ